MDTLITIRPFELENRKIRKNTTRIPGTIRKSQVDNEVANKFRTYNKVKRGVISSEVLYSMKPELMISFPKYEERLSLKTAVERLAKSNVLISEIFGRKDLRVTPEQLDKALTDALEKKNINLSSYKEVKEKISLLEKELQEKENKINEQQKEISELKRKEIVYTTVISEYEDQQMIDEDIKLIA